LKILAPENRVPLDEYGIKDELTKLYGKQWGAIILRNLKQIDAGLAEKIEKIIDELPEYDPSITIEDDLKKLIDLGPETKTPKKGRKKKPGSIVTKVDKNLHNTIIDMIEQIGNWENKHAETEYQIGNLGRLDAVWKRIKTGNPSYAFEVQIKGNFYQALAKLKHAFDLWNSTPVLVTTQDFEKQALELLSGSFHEMKKHAKVINYEKIKEWFSIEKKLQKLKNEIDL
jgi:predicted RNA-binding protein